MEKFTFLETNYGVVHSVAFGFKNDIAIPHRDFPSPGPLNQARAMSPLGRC